MLFWNNIQKLITTYLVVMTLSVAAWFTHLFVCFSDDRWGFLIAGAIMFPIAIVHGVGVWFGFW